MFNKTLIVAVLALSPQPVWAHAHLERSTPNQNATVSTAPAKVTGTFSEGLESAFSSMTLLDAAGKTVPTGASSVAPGDDKTLVLPVDKGLPAGTYTVKWQALSKDGHKTRGSWSFSIQR